MGHRILLCALVIITCCVYNVAGDERVRVKVSQGWLEGEWLQTVTGDAKYCSFKGIPYARPPIGNLRFKAPKPPTPWKGVRNATEHGSICPQVDLISDEFIAGNEDCLFLNVYTRHVNPKHKMPVLFFIHGGIFKHGSGDVDMYGPDFLVERNVVVVTINYRLHVLGFLCMDTEEVPGNAGLKDQVAALRWVNKNIENFGGDPDCVTIMGAGSGGASVSLHLVSPLTKGLFKRAISISGSPFCDWAVPVAAAERSYTVGKKLGLDTNDPVELLQFMQRAPIEKLIKINPSLITNEVVSENILYKEIEYTPVIEVAGTGNYVNETIYKSLESGNVHKVDVLCGHKDKESTFLIEPIISSYLQKYDTYPDLLVQNKLYYFSTVGIILEASARINNHYFGNKTINTGVLREFLTYMDDVNFIYDIHNFMDMLPKTHNRARYFYRFSALSDRNFYGNMVEKKYGISGATFLDDLFYLFDPKTLNMKITKNSREYRLVQFVTTIFTNFIKRGNPTPDSSLGVKWPEYNKTTRHSVDISDSLTIRRNEDANTIQFWDEIYGANKQQIYKQY